MLVYVGLVVSKINPKDVFVSEAFKSIYDASSAIISRLHWVWDGRRTIRAEFSSASMHSLPNVEKQLLDGETYNSDYICKILTVHIIQKSENARRREREKRRAAARERRLARQIIRRLIRQAILRARLRAARRKRKRRRLRKKRRKS